MKEFAFILLFVMLGCKKQDDSNTLVSIYIPNAFYPNSSVPCQQGNVSCNTVFQVMVKDASVLESFEITIYDKQQNPVFKATTHQFAWNGLLNNKGAEQEAGTYFYLIKYVDIKGQSTNKTGNVQLVR